jgi:Mg-chelatase subunit ChlD
VRATLECINGGACRRLCARACVAALALLVGGSATAFAQQTPRDIVLMLDNSGSMRKNDPEFLTSVAVRAFLEHLEGENRVAVIAFDERVNVLMPLTAVDAGTRQQFLDSLDAINYRGRLTNSPAALERSLYELRISGRADAERSIVFLTDGIVDVAPEGADAGDLEKARWMKSTLVDEAVDQNVRIFGIAFTDDADFELIQTLAKRTGGQYYRAYSASDIDTVFTNLRAELSTAVPTAARGTDVAVPAAPGPPVPEPVSAAPQTPEPGPETETEAPGDTLPLSDRSATELPLVSLPEDDLPRVTLPPVSLDGESKPLPVPTTQSVAADGAQPSGDHTPGTPAETTQDTPQPEIGAPDRTRAAPPLPPPAPRVDDSPLMLVLAIGGGALLLALLALIVALARRRSGDAPAAADPLMPKAFLNDIGGVTAQKSYELDEKPTIVGRLAGPDSDAAHYIVIDESTIGRRHALLEYKEHSFWAADQNSLNGTFVNNTRIEEPTRLKHGDRVRFHKHEFEFLVLDMFETDRTMMSHTLFTDLPAENALSDRKTGRQCGKQDRPTVVRESDAQPPAASPHDPTVTRR